MSTRKTRPWRDQEAEQEHAFALADLQDAVDRTGDGSDGDGEADWKRNLQRALERERAAHEAVQRRRRRETNRRE